MNGTATIINYTANAHAIVSAAGRISTTPGSADEIYRNSSENAPSTNLKLIGKILSSGHESVLEHVSVNLSFDNVSVYVEQFMIEFRLASFTVKSRRYVDFGQMGYVTPDFSSFPALQEEDLRTTYRSHIEYLFGRYSYLMEKGVPKEDARFVLPYSFKSNFYCTVNGRELIKIMNEMAWGRGKDFPELVRLGRSLFDQCRQCLPFLAVQKTAFDLRQSLDRHLTDDFKNSSMDLKEGDTVTLLGGTRHPEQLICQAALLNCGICRLDDAKPVHTEMQKTIIAQILKSSRKRELEQACFTLRFNRISLAGITHLVRHRMQSAVIPDYIRTCSFGRYVVPESIVHLGLEEEYREVFRKAGKAADRLGKMGIPFHDRIYLLLSGMTLPVMTTMNANELNTFIRLRTCNRAQWEIKECADALLKILRETYPVLFSFYGPSCFVSGTCPEGRMSCGKMREVREFYGM